MKIFIAAIGLMASFPAFAQTPAVKEVVAAYCFGALSTHTQLIEDKNDEKCQGNADCHAAIARFGTAGSVNGRKSHIIRYLTSRGFPQREELRAAVGEGAADMDRCAWRGETAAGTPVKRSSTADETSSSSEECAFVDTCQQLSWLEI